MSRIANSERQLGKLLDDVHAAPALTRDLFVRIIQEGCTRLSNSNGRSRAGLSNLVEEGAWIDAALVLLELDSPQWKLRRLICEDDEWFCSLSRCRNVPLELDDTADARHDDAALAVLAAFLESGRKTAAEYYRNDRLGRAADKGIPVDCENFA